MDFIYGVVNYRNGDVLLAKNAEFLSHIVSRLLGQGITPDEFFIVIIPRAGISEPKVLTEKIQ